MESTLRIAACDLGKASARFVVARMTSGGLTLEDVRAQPHDGDPFDVFKAWYEELSVASCAALAATGVHADELKAPVHVLPEDSCQEAALEVIEGLEDALNLISIGARGYGVLTRRPETATPDEESHYRYEYLENEKCSSGTGENIQKIADRFGLSIEDADQLALAADDAIPITARCSVFAKSEMTHYANQGKPTGALFKGYFGSVARNTYGLALKNLVDGPYYLIGGPARIQTFRRALEDLVGQPVKTPAHAAAFEAIGAAAIAGTTALQHPGPALPADASALIESGRHRFQTLRPSKTAKENVTIIPPMPREAQAAVKPAILGLDLGSTGAKAVLTAIDNGELIYDVYDRTRGNPVDAARRLITRIIEDCPADVRGVGVTGSGREAVATLLRAVFAGSEQIVVLNEIIAHATAAIRCDADDGADLSVIEIGGQDAKYIRVQGGRIVESDMNKACSAGTGSFLEEQANLYDVHDIDEFIELAASAENPPDLGQMCTVFVADAAALAVKEGFTRADIFAGFQYSVIHNYLNRVMGQRTLGARVFFQGKPATNSSLAWALAAVTDRDIVVPPNPGAMGAWGIGLCAIEELGPDRLLGAPSLELGATLDADIAERAEFRCQDPDCQTLCPIERTTIRVGDVSRKAFAGGACPKFELATKNQPKLAKDAPNPFEAREALIDSFIQVPGDDVPRITIPAISSVAHHVPWLATLLQHLGLGVELMRSDSDSLARGEQLCASYDACGPVKIAYAVCDTDADFLLFPKIFTVADAKGLGGNTCIGEMAAPEVMANTLASQGRAVQVLRPQLAFDEGLANEKLIAALQGLAEQLDVDPGLVPDAVHAAAAAQERFEEELERIGTDALAYARANDLPAVILVGKLHVISDPAINAGIPHVLRKNGAMAIPVDCYPLPEETPLLRRAYWGDDNRLLRAAVAARESRDAFPVLLASFGCGPAAFTEQVLQSVLEGYPHTILESDGHGGEAGFVTRIQSFLQSVRQFIAEDRAAALFDTSHRLGWLDHDPANRDFLQPDIHYVTISYTENMSDVFAGVFRAYGYDASAAPIHNEATRDAARRDCSGKECQGYQNIWGAFRHYLDEHPPTRQTRLLSFPSNICRAGLFDVKDKISLEKMGLGDLVDVEVMSFGRDPIMTRFTWSGLWAVEILRQLYIYHLAVEPHEGASRAVYDGFAHRVITTIERPLADPDNPAQEIDARIDDLAATLVDAAGSYVRMEATWQGKEPLLTVYASGQTTTKGNDLASIHLYKLMSQQGLRLVLDPVSDLFEYFQRPNPRLLDRYPDPAAVIAYIDGFLLPVRDRLYRDVQAIHPWLPQPDVMGLVEKAAELLDPETFNPVVMEVGAATYAFDSGKYDGVVMAACWGCDNSLVTEQLLRTRRDIPFLFHYDDGTPIDERRIRSYCHRLKRTVARARGANERLIATG